MLYCILIYSAESELEGISKEEDDALVALHRPLHEKLIAEGRMGPVLRLTPTKTATTLHDAGTTVLDGPYAETKEQLLGLYVVDCESREEAIEVARLIPTKCARSLEIRPVCWFHPGVERSDVGHVEP